ncbi:hypothetical protein DPMN_010021 [Dreissena polymorpha]|uniref:Uncharacterized protein n=1 Tax=Dreissena polymorpha TaxID=45954 RepID=A0A9D4S0K6_DREPO|nr:hypothetical protein DPMN_010021 [Dreissena polymorpha]
MVIVCKQILVSLPRRKRGGDSGDGSVEDWRGGPSAALQARISRGGPMKKMEVSKDDGSQNAQRAGETVLGVRARAKREEDLLLFSAVALQSNLVLVRATRYELSINCLHGVICHRALVYLYRNYFVGEYRGSRGNFTSHIAVMCADKDASREIHRLLCSCHTVIFAVHSVPRMLMRTGLTGGYYF